MKVSICRHIKTNGLQCHAVQLTNSVFCYFHRKLNEGHALYRSTLVGRKDLMSRGHIIALPALEDRLSVQLALSEVINALACNFIDSKRANALLYGLQLASANSRGLETITQPLNMVRKFSAAPDLLDSISTDIAPAGLTCEIEDPAAPIETPAPSDAPAPIEAPTTIAMPAPIEMPEPPYEQQPQPPAQHPADNQDWTSAPPLSLCAEAIDSTLHPVAPHPCALAAEPTSPTASFALPPLPPYNQPNPTGLSFLNEHRTSDNEQQRTSNHDHYPDSRSSDLRRRSAHSCL